MRLLISQKNKLFDLIQNVDLSPSQFEFQVNNYTDGTSNTEIWFKNSEYFFLFDSNAGMNYVEFSPTFEKFSEKAYVAGWEMTLDRFGEWIYCLKREIQIQDKWETLDQQIQEVNINFSDEQHKFSAREYEDLKANILILKQGVSTLAMLPDQINAINSKLDHLSEMAVDMNKFDWNNLFIGTIISIIIQLSVTQDNAKALWTLIKQVFNNYFLVM